MTVSSSAIEAWVAQTICGSLITQIAENEGLSLSDLSKEEHLGNIERLAHQLEHTGIDPELVARHTISSLSMLFMRRENAQQMIDGFTDILWHLLGDPKTGGDSPPAIYRRAGFYMHLAFIGFFDPTIPEKVLSGND